MTCIAPLPSTLVFNKEITTLDVVTKMQALTDAVKADGSLLLYMKDTIETIFNDYEISEEEKGRLIASTIGQMVVTANHDAMAMAVQWASVEEEQAYTLAKLKNDALISEMNLYKAYSESCLVGANIALTEAQADKTVADMIMEDGKVTGRDTNGVITGLDGTGVKAAQYEQIINDIYIQRADSYRKSGVVEIGVDISDGITKGISGDLNGQSYWQMKVTERQEKGFDDNMRQHAANSASQMISFMLSGDASDAIQEADVTRWRNAVDYLLT